MTLTLKFLFSSNQFKHLLDFDLCNIYVTLTFLFSSNQFKHLLDLDLCTIYVTMTFLFSSSQFKHLHDLDLCSIHVTLTFVVSSNQFKHQRMADGNMEINNPIYMKDYDDEDADGFSFDGDKVREKRKYCKFY